MNSNGTDQAIGTKQTDQFALTTSERTGERHLTAEASAKQQEIQGRMILAKKFPRNEDEAFAALMKAAARPSFAEDAGYSFPRGDQSVEGPSVNMAREGARVWGNISYGIDILRDDADTRHIRGWAWDMQTNAYTSSEDDFKKLVQRKVKGSNPPRTEWVPVDERDLRELTNRRGAILVRNCLLQLLPKDMVQEAFLRCKETLSDKAAKDPDGTRKAIIASFAELNVTPTMLEAKLGHSLTQCTPTEIAELRRIYKSIADGNSTWAEYVNQEATQKAAPAGQTDQDMADVQARMAAAAKPADKVKPAGESQAKDPVKPADAGNLKTNMKEIAKEDWDLIVNAIMENPNLRAIMDEVKTGMKVKTLNLVAAGQHEFLRRFKAEAEKQGFAAQVNKILG